MKVENGGSISHFNDISKIKGISQKTIEKLEKFCENQIGKTNPEEIGKTNPAETKQPISKIDECSQSIDSFNGEYIGQDIFPEHFGNSSSFILYDEGIPPVDLSMENSKATHINPSYSKTGMKNGRVLKLALQPKLTEYSAIRSFTSIYQDATAVTCTRFSTNDDWLNDIHIDAWNYYKVQAIQGKNLWEILDQVVHLVDKIPSSDIYIMHDHNKAQHFRKPILPKKLSEIIQISQQCAIFAALLQNRNVTTSIEKKQPNVHFMCYSTVGRLYDLMVGYETISTQPTIKKFLRNPNETLPESVKLNVNNEITNRYFKSHPVDREYLGKSMLIGLTFIRLGLLKEK